MSGVFRNVEGSPQAPVEEWPHEGLVATIERGTLGDWLPIIHAIRDSPWGSVARRVESYLGYATPYGVGPLLQRTVKQARADAQAREREAVAAEVRELMARSGLSQQGFAQAIGTSRSRLSTYASGKVTPAATLLVRMRAAADDAGRRAGGA